MGATKSPPWSDHGALGDSRFVLVTHAHADTRDPWRARSNTRRNSGRGTSLDEDDKVEHGRCPELPPPADDHLHDVIGVLEASPVRDVELPLRAEVIVQR